MNDWYSLSYSVIHLEIFQFFRWLLHLFHLIVIPSSSGIDCIVTYPGPFLISLIHHIELRFPIISCILLEITFDTILPKSSFNQRIHLPPF